MINRSEQTQAWFSEFGVEYTDRNMMTMEEMDSLYKKRYGVSRTDMNTQFIGGLNRNFKILEVGSNIGNQLLCLQREGFKNLYGIELSSYTVELSKKKTQGINIIQGSALDIPFKDNYFDIVFTSAVLIHINPEELHIALGEIYRCSKTYIWGLEYFSEEYAQIKYRQSKETCDLLWKANFPQIYCEQFSDLEIVKTRMFGYLCGDNMDIMYLLKKQDKG